MKFRIRVSGKDSVDEGLFHAASQKIKDEHPGQWNPEVLERLFKKEKTGEIREPVRRKWRWRQRCCHGRVRYGGSYCPCGARKTYSEEVKTDLLDSRFSGCTIVKTTFSPGEVMSETKTRKEMVRWTSDEMEKLASLVVRMRINDPISAGHILIQKAMDQLPKDRRRVVNSFKQVPKLADEIRRHMRLFGELADKGSLPPPEPPPPPPAPPPPPTAEEIVAKWTTEQLLAAAFGRVMGVLGKIEHRQGSIEEHVKSLLLASARLPAPAGVNTTTAPPSSSPRLDTTTPRIAIVGLLGDQQNAVRKGVGNKVDLRFVSKDQTRPSFPHVDYIVLVTKFIGHEWDRAAMSTLPRDRVHRHRGGISELIALIHTLC